MVILIAKPDALDQYFMRHPDDLFGRSYEAAILDPNNPHVVRAHLPCAAAERPITLEDDRFWSEDLSSHLEKLELEGELRRTAEGEPVWYAAKPKPHLHVNIRSAGDTYTIFEDETGQAIGTVDKILGGGRYQITLESGQVVTAQLSGRMRRFRIRVIPGDRVQVGVSPYDPTHGFVTFRLREGQNAPR